MGNHPLIFYIFVQILSTVYNLIQIKFLLILLILFFSCSTSEKTTDRQEQEGDSYVFDEIPPEDVFTIQSPKEKETEKFIIQIGAFSSEDRAESFAQISEEKLNRSIKVVYDQKVRLFLVQIHPTYESRKEAELMRDTLWKLEEYSDAWIKVISPEEKTD